MFQRFAATKNSSFTPQSSSGTIDQAFDAAFLAEFGLTVQQYYDLMEIITDEAINRDTPVVRLPMSETLQCFRDADICNPIRAFEMLSLAPRSRWDEAAPCNAERRDWYPWRYKRRLSLIRCPIVRLSHDANADILIMPTLLDVSLRYLCEALGGRLPVRLFDSQEMRAWIGLAADRDGHEFNRQVAKRLRSLGWMAQAELRITELGGDPEFGDVDVLAWCCESGGVYAIECKRLFIDRTVGEIGERLVEYSVAGDATNKTPLQRHMDRKDVLGHNLSSIATITSIPPKRIRLFSALITDGTTPMQFASEVLNELDIVADYENLQAHFG